ncbi:bifunctional Peptidase M18/Peptidase M18 [Babesia duncani]|uniref:aspartyl aminopeptidase n=1 Tax=Babesia duncani TaxID=323732 RepID=A0AAD9PMW7_9APIC|nr:bifunctional Peptidase M18/Peptidase M18 [Babesia duncani]
MALTAQTLKESQDFVKGFCTYLDGTGSPWHSVEQLLKYMSHSKVPLVHLKECEEWVLEKGKTYCIVDRNATIMIFHVGAQFNPQNGGLVLAAAHTDSPCLKLDFKSHSEAHGYNQVNVCTYGGGLWHTWLDRELGIAGKVLVRKNDGLEEHLVHVKRPLVILPNLAIHLQTAHEREALKISKEKHLKGITSTKLVAQLSSVEVEPLMQLIANAINCNVQNVFDWDLCLMDNAPATLSGIHEEFLSCARLDNLASCFACVAGFVDSLAKRDKMTDSNNISTSNDEFITGIVCYNYEEIGSQLSAGTDSQITTNWLERILKQYNTHLDEIRHKSIILSVDMAHGIHPNYPEKHLTSHAPRLHEGI